MTVFKFKFLPPLRGRSFKFAILDIMDPDGDEVAMKFDLNGYISENDKFSFGELTLNNLNMNRVKV